MKKTILISIVLSLVASATMAQNQKGANVIVPGEPLPIDGPGGGGGITNYYTNTTGTITKPGYTYGYRNKKIGGEYLSGSLELYNVTNPYLDVEWGHKDGTPLSFAEETGRITTPYVSNISQTLQQTLAMVDGLFSTLQKNTLKGKSLFIELRIDSSTDQIADVYFNFMRHEPFVNIPVETFRSIELSLKQNLSVTVTEQGRKMNYIMLYWSQKF